MLPPRRAPDAVVEGTFAAEPSGGDPIPGRVTIGDAEPIPVSSTTSTHGLVVEPQDEISAYLNVTHPEQLAADEDRVERLKRDGARSGRAVSSATVSTCGVCGNMSTG